MVVAVAATWVAVAATWVVVAATWVVLAATWVVATSAVGDTGPRLVDLLREPRLQRSGVLGVRRLRWERAAAIPAFNSARLASFIGACSLARALAGFGMDSTLSGGRFGGVPPIGAGAGDSTATLGLPGGLGGLGGLGLVLEPIHLTTTRELKAFHRTPILATAMTRIGAT